MVLRIYGALHIHLSGISDSSTPGIHEEKLTLWDAVAF